MRNVIYWILGGFAVIIILIGVVIVKLEVTKDKVVLPAGQVTEKGANDIRVLYPVSNDYISSPLVVTGEAKGTWYFEASFPVILTDWDGKIIAQVPAQAQGNWMTTNFVPFTATLNFVKPGYGKNGFLILKKDNPSGLSQNDDSLEIPVNFK